jgi:integrase/recombinase XerC
MYGVQQTTKEHVMPTATTITRVDREQSQWDQAFYAFLAEKERRSGSLRTVQSYSRMLDHFWSGIGKTPDQVSPPEVFSWAHGIGLSGKRPSAVTIGARIACLSSFYRFLIRMGFVISNPCEAIERPKSVPSHAKGLTADEIQKLLGVIPTSPSGLRDRALVLTFVFTARRRAEIIGLTAGNLFREGDSIQYTYRGKGGKTGKRELPRPAYDAIVTALAAWDKSFDTMAPEESLWPSANNPNGLTSGTFYGNLQRYLKKAGLPRAGVHIFRHSGAKLRRDVGESVEDVSRFLDHSSLAVTTVYLRRLEGQQDLGWAKVAAAIGM